jgi:GNAT superfamily N-acetyltransferase
VGQLRDELIGYLLGLEYSTFFANGSVAHVEEIMVSETFRQKGIGSLLIKSFENWATDRECKLVTVATRRAPGFYKALHFEESAAYFRKPITGVPKAGR